MWGVRVGGYACLRVFTRLRLYVSAFLHVCMSASSSVFLFGCVLCLRVALCACVVFVQLCFCLLCYSIFCDPAPSDSLW